MLVLFDAIPPRKPARSFGAGVLPSHPTYTADHSAEDDAWLVEDNARREAAARPLSAAQLESPAFRRRFTDHMAGL